MPDRITRDEKVALTRLVLRTLERWEIPPG
jgi:hypothetical protein